MPGQTPWLNIDETEEKMRRSLEIAKEYGVNLMVPDFAPRESFCRHPFNHFLVRWDGAVVSCVGHRFLLGDINSSTVLSFRNLLKSLIATKLKRDFRNQ